MISNPKIDSKSEFGGPDTAEERERSARGTSEANGQTCWPRVPHGQHGSLPTCATRGPHMVLMWHAVVGRWPILLLSRSACVLQPYAGFRTLILNPSSNYES